MSGQTQYSAKYSRSPYKVEVAPGFKADNSAEMDLIHREMQGEQEARSYEHKQLIGSLDSLSSEFINLFSTLSVIRNKAEDATKMDGVDTLHVKSLNKIISLVDQINSVIINKIVPEIDELGRR